MRTNEEPGTVVRDEEWADRTFPDRGPQPSNEVVVDLEAGRAPNTEHPE
jgi:hypothetical protein